MASKTKKHDPTYYLTVTTSPSSGSTPNTKELKTPFTTWFTADGFFVAQPFQQWLASGVQEIGDADAKNVVKREDVIEVLAASGVDANGTPGPEGKSSKGSKKGKRKG